MSSSEPRGDLELHAQIVVRGAGGPLDPAALRILDNILTRDVALALRTSADRVNVTVGTDVVGELKAEIEAAQAAHAGDGQPHRLTDALAAILRSHGYQLALPS